MLAGNDKTYLYHNSTIALNGDDGKIVWYYQHLNDNWDLDHPFERLLVDTAVAPDPSEVAWINPHGIVSCDVKDDAGKVSRWTLEMGSPSAMTRVGWDRNSLSPGDVVKIDVNPAKNGTNFGRLLRVAKADGKMLRYIEPGSRGEPRQN